jgi:hypothetical protein
VIALAQPVPGAIRIFRFATAFEARLLGLPPREWEGGRASIMADMLAAQNPKRDGAWRHRFCVQQEAGELVARGVREGTLPIWTMAPHGPHLIDHWHLEAIDSQAIKTGVFKPRDATHPLHGTLLWVKREDADHWADEVVAALYPEAVKPKGTAKLEAECGHWLETEFAAGVNGRRDDFQTRAQQRFPGLAARQFIRAWERHAPAYGRNRAGRPRGNK